MYRSIVGLIITRHVASDILRVRGAMDFWGVGVGQRHKFWDQMITLLSTGYRKIIAVKDGVRFFCGREAQNSFFGAAVPRPSPWLLAKLQANMQYL